jgi:hypothetical protein
MCTAPKPLGAQFSPAIITPRVTTDYFFAPLQENGSAKLSVIAQLLVTVAQLKLSGMILDT